MKLLSERQQMEVASKVDRSLIEKVETVYHQFTYVMKDRNPGHMLKMFREDGTPVLEFVKLPKGYGKRGYWRPLMLHPENILTEDSPPILGDYLQLTDKDNKPCENNTIVFVQKEKFSNGVWLVEDVHSTMYFVVRNPDYDTSKQRGWLETQQLKEKHHD